LNDKHLFKVRNVPVRKLNAYEIKYRKTFFDKHGVDREREIKSKHFNKVYKETD
jgi:hypothetical protein